MPTLVLLGAGSIGRSFIGQLFARGGYEVVFVDVDDRIVDALNERRSYRVEVRDDPAGEILVEGVRAVHGANQDGVVRELLHARVAATAVGANVLPQVVPTLAAGIRARHEAGKPPLDLILCENLHSAAALVEAGLRQHLPAEFPLDEAVGLVETSIGKMVPLMTESERSHDPLLVASEAYNTLIVDRRAFRQPVPRIPGLDARENMKAYVDRKLYIHNLGHAAIAYGSFRLHPEIKTIDCAVARADIARLTSSAMGESASALARAYPEEFTPQSLHEYLKELLHRFANPALGDTVFRVGRDVRRKLSRDDRIIGAMRMDLSQGISCQATAQVAAAALCFRATDERGRLDPADAAFLRDDLPLGIDHILDTICALDSTDRVDGEVRRQIREAAA